MERTRPAIAVDQSFAFQAVRADGAVTAGTLDAESSTAARDIVLSRGLLVLSVRTLAARAERREPLPVRDLALGLRIIADLLESGLPVSRALHAFSELAPRAWRPALPHLRDAVREGKSFATALESAPIEIPALVIGITHGGESGGGIGPAVRRAADLMEARAETRAAIRSALAYPAVVAVAGVAAITVLMTVVLPRFAGILADLGQTLPASTRLVLRLSAAVRSSALPAAMVIAFGYAIWKSWVGTTVGRRRWHAWLLSLPLIGSVRRGIATAHIAHSLAAMLETGVPLAAALVIASRAAGDAAIEARLADVRRLLSAGHPLSQALATTDAATPTAVRLVRAGEEAGRLSSMLGHAARIEQKRVDEIVRTAVRLLEPVLLLGFASMVALVAAALLQAIYSVRPGA